MVRSLDDGVSGLQAEQTAMDVIGNNIANVSTTGFKSSRVTFKESMTQMLRGASRPPGMPGGTNPMQLGLGTSVGSIDTLITQGNLQSTGQITDLALEGQAYFVYSNGTGDYYSRLGALQFDSTGRLVSPTNGFALQGITAAQDGTYPASATIGDIVIPYGEKAPAKASTEITYGCNLNSDSMALGTIDHTNAFYTNVGNVGTDPVTDLYDSSGNSLGIEPGDILTVSAGNAGVVPVQIPVTAATALTPATTLQDVANAISNVANQVAPGFVNVTIANGQISVANTSGTAILNLQVTSNRLRT
jgi:flagellar hook protein FlgE